jgi:LAGLIDADG endonuclease
MLITDRNFSTSFYDAAGGGDPVLYQHLFLWNIDYIYSLALSSLPLITPKSYSRSFDFTSFYTMYEIIYPNQPKPRESFLEWLIGFTEGDGSFIVVTRGGLQFVISQSTSDLQVLHYILNNLCFGKIIQQSKIKNTHRFIVQDMKHIMMICLLFNGNMVFFTRNAKFLIFLATYNIIALRRNLDIIPPIMNTILPTLNDAWLSGFTDAEGCFSLTLLSNSLAYHLRFILSKKWDINKSIFIHIASLFNVGFISTHSAPNNWQYTVNGVKNTVSIFPYFDQHALQTKKRDSYLLWKELRMQLINKDHLNLESRKEMIKLAKRVNNQCGNKGNGLA